MLYKARFVALLATLLVLALVTAGRRAVATSPLAPVDSAMHTGAATLAAASDALIPAPTPTPAPTEAPPPPAYVTSGYAAHYSAGLMGRVADNRGIRRQNCMISYTDATDASLGNLWLLVVSDIDGDSAWCLVVDLPQRRHYAGIKRRGIVVELDLETAKRLCNISYAGQEPPRACPVTVYR